MKHFNLRCLVPLLALLAPAISAGQSITGLSDLYYNAGSGKVEAWGQTWADYSTYYYYDLEIGTTLNANGVWAGGGWQCCQGSYAATWIEADVIPAAEYTVTSSHSANIYYTVYDFGFYCTWDCYNSYDVFGYGWDGCLPDDPGYACTPPFWSVTGWARATAMTIATVQLLLGHTEKKTTPLGPATPTYFIKASAFIPFPYIDAPPQQAICFNGNVPHFQVFGGDNRTYSPFSMSDSERTNYRTLTLAAAHIGQGLQSSWVDGGITNRFALPVPFDPDGSIAFSAFDSNADDCYLRTGKGDATEELMFASATASPLAPNSLSVHLWGFAHSELAFGPGIDWDYTINLTAEPGIPAVYTMTFTFDCFPAHEVWITANPTLLWGYTPNFSDITTIGFCLAGILPQVSGVTFGTIN